MATTDDLHELARLCNAAARAASAAIDRLGPRPDDPAQAEAWRAHADRLNAQVGRLTGLAGTFADLAVSASLDAAWPQLERLREATATAEERIARMAAISDAAKKIAQVVDLGIAVLALAAGPSPAGAVGVVQALGKVLD
ncbi:MAG: hypothetical protein ACJ8ER_04475 [Allosphingosinicella sp.]